MKDGQGKTELVGVVGLSLNVIGIFLKVIL